MTIDVEEMIRAVRICMPQTPEDTEISCGECAYYSDCLDGESVTLPARMVMDILRILEIMKQIMETPTDIGGCDRYRRLRQMMNLDEP